MSKKFYVDEQGVGLQGYSPVSYVDLGAAEPGKPEYSAEYNGVTYLFTSADQVTAFNADPAKYEPAFGGWCAFGQTVGQQFVCDPNSFKVVDGKLMTFLKNDEVDAKALWEEGDEQELLRKARENWTALAD